MGKKIDIPENLSKTQIVEEIYRNLKDAPKNHQIANAEKLSKTLEHDSHDVVNLTPYKEYHKIDADEQADKKKGSDEQKKERKKIDDSEAGESNNKEDEEDEEQVETIYNKKGIIIDIKG